MSQKSASPAVAPATQLAAASAAGGEPALAWALPDDFDECVALYFDCETAQERDGFLKCLTARHDEEVNAFLLAMMVEDDDAFMRLQAALCLSQRGHAQGRAFLTQSLAINQDDDLFAAAIEAWVELHGVDAAPELAAICKDGSRSASERMLSLQGLLQADLDVAAKLCVELLEPGCDVPLDNDLIETMMPALVGQAAYQAAAQHALRRRLASVASTLPALTEARAKATSEEAAERAQDRVDDAREAQQVLEGCLALLQAQL